jgi:hypothetical protein
MLALILTLCVSEPLNDEDLRRWEEDDIVVVSRQPFLNVFVVDEAQWEAAKRERRAQRRTRRRERRARRAERREQD